MIRCVSVLIWLCLFGDGGGGEGLQQFVSFGRLDEGVGGLTGGLGVGEPGWICLFGEGGGGEGCESIFHVSNVVRPCMYGNLGWLYGWTGRRHVGIHRGCI